MIGIDSFRGCKPHSPGDEYRHTATLFEYLYSKPALLSLAFFTETRRLSATQACIKGPSLVELRAVVLAPDDAACT